MSDRVLIVDFGSQVTQLIARRVRECGVYCEILPCTADPAAFAAFDAKAVILSGGPASVTRAEAPAAPGVVFELVDRPSGGQQSLGGGGRYDGLVKALGGNDVPALGFAYGIDQVVRAIEGDRGTASAQGPVSSPGKDDGIAPSGI